MSANNVLQALALRYSPGGRLTAAPSDICKPLIFKENPMKLRPLHDRVIVKRIENERKTASGIVIPDNAAEKPDQGEVMAVGPGKKDDQGKLIAMDLKVGDRILFGKYSGQTVKVDGDEVLVMREDDVMAVVEGAPIAAVKAA
jgi:chaperonin GroES